MIIELRKAKRARSAKCMTDDQVTNNRLLASIQWVARARGDDTTRMILTYLHVNKTGDIVATDGRRLHKATVKTDKLEPGLYRVLKTGAVVWLDKMPDDTGKYPDYDIVIPKTTDIEETVNCSDTSNVLFSSCVAANKASGGGVYNAAYIDDAIPAGMTWGDIKFQGIDKLSPLVVIHDIGTAVIMPMRTW